MEFEMSSIYSSPNVSVNSSFNQSSSSEFPEWTGLVLYIRITLTAFIVSFGLAGNFTTVIVFSSKGLKKTPCAVFFKILALVDNVFLGTLLINLINENFSPVLDSDFACQLFVYLQYLAAILSVWFIIAITLERLIAITLPLSCKTICSIAREKIIVVVLFFIVGLLYCFSFWVTVSVPVDDQWVCSLKHEYIQFVHTATWVDSVITMIVPCFTICTVNCLIIVYIRRSSVRSIAAESITRRRGLLPFRVHQRTRLGVLDKVNRQKPSCQTQEYQPIPIKQLAESPVFTHHRLIKHGGNLGVRETQKDGICSYQLQNITYKHINEQEKRRNNSNHADFMNMEFKEKRHIERAVKQQKFLKKSVNHPKTLVVRVIKGGKEVNTRNFQLDQRTERRKSTLEKMLSKRQKQDLQITKTILLVTTVFLVLNSPSHVFRLHNLTQSTLSTDHTISASFYLFQEISSVLYNMSFSFNFILYAFCSRKIRTAFIDLLKNKAMM